MYIFKKFSFAATLLVILSACTQPSQVVTTAPLPKPDPAVVVNVGNENALMVVQACGYVGQLSVSGAGVVADDIFFGEKPQQVVFRRRFLGDRETDLVLIVYSDDQKQNPIATYNQRIRVNERHVWSVSKLQGTGRRYSYASRGECRETVDNIDGERYARQAVYDRRRREADQRRNGRTILGGLITVQGRVDARVSNSRTRTRRTTKSRTAPVRPHGPPAWPNN
jgi:hypothetical protein